MQKKTIESSSNLVKPSSIFNDLIKNYKNAVVSNKSILAAFKKIDTSIVEALERFVLLFPNPQEQYQKLLSFLYQEIFKKRESFQLTSPFNFNKLLNEENLEQNLIIDIVILSLLVSASSFKEYQLIIEFLLDQKFSQDQDKNLISDLLILKARSLKTEEDIQDFNKYLIVINEKYNLTYQSNGFAKNTLQVVPLRFFKSNKYSEEELDQYQNLIIECFKQSTVLSKAVDQNLMMEFLEIGINRISQCSRNLINDYAGVSKKAHKLINFLNFIHTEYGFLEKNEFKLIRQRILIQEIKLLDAIALPNYIKEFAEKLQDIQNFIPECDRIEFTSLLFQEGIKKLNFIIKKDQPPAQYLPTVFQTLKTSDKFSLFCQDFIIAICKSLEIVSKELNEAYAHSLLEGLYELLKITSQENKNFSLSAFLNELIFFIESILKKFIEHSTSATFYVKGINHFTNLLSISSKSSVMSLKFNAENLSSFLRHKDDYKIIILALLKSRYISETSFIKENLEYFILNKPFILLAILHHLQIEKSLLHNESQLIEIIKADNRLQFPLLASFIQLQGEYGFFVSLPQEIEAFEKINIKVIELNHASFFDASEDEKASLLASACLSMSALSSKNFSHTRSINALLLCTLLFKPSSKNYENFIINLSVVPSSSPVYKDLLLDLIIFRIVSLEKNEEINDFKVFLEKTIVRNLWDISIQMQLEKALQAVLEDNQLQKIKILTDLKPTLGRGHFTTTKDYEWFINEVFQLKKTYRLSDSKINRLLLLYLLKAGSQVASKTKLNNNYFFELTNQIDQYNKVSLAKESQGFFNFLKSLSNGECFSFSPYEQTEILVLQSDIVTKNIKSLFLSCRIEFIEKIKIVAGFCQFCDEKDLQGTIQELLPLVYEEIKDVFFQEKNKEDLTLYISRVKTNFEKQIIEYVLIQHIKKIKSKRGVAQLFEDFVRIIHDIDWIKSLLQHYLNYCDSIQEDHARVEAYHRFYNFVLYPTSLNYKDVVYYFWTKIPPQLTSSNYISLIYLLKNNLKSELSQKEPFKIFLVGTLPILQPKVLDQPQEYSRFIDLIVDLKNAIKFDEGHVKALDKITLEVIHAQIEVLFKQLNNLEDQFLAFQISKSIDENLNLFKGYDSIYSAYLEKLENHQKSLSIHKESYKNQQKKRTNLKQDLAFETWAFEDIYTYLKQIERYEKDIELDLEKFKEESCSLEKKLDDELNGIIKEQENKYQNAFNRYEKFLKGFEDVLSEDQILLQQKDKILNLLESMKGKEETGRIKLYDNIQFAFQGFPQRFSQFQFNLKQQKENLGQLEKNAQVSEISSDKALIEQLNEINKFDLELDQAMTFLNFWQKERNALAEAEHWVKNIAQQEVNNINRYEKIKSFSENLYLDLQHKIEEFQFLKAEYLRQKEKFHIDKKISDQPLEETLGLISEALKKDFEEIDQSLKNVDESFKEAQRQFKLNTQELDEILKSSEKLTLEEKNEKIVQFEERIQTLNRFLLEKSNLVEQKLFNVEKDLKQQQEKISQTLSNAVGERKRQKEELEKIVEAQNKAQIELEKGIKNEQSDAWLKEQIERYQNKEITENELENLEIRQEYVKNIITSINQAKESIKKVGSQNFQSISEGAKSILESIEQYSNQIQAILDNNAGWLQFTQIVLNIFDNRFFSWLPFVQTARDFKEKQESLTAYKGKFQEIKSQVENLKPLVNPFDANSEIPVNSAVIKVMKEAHHALIKNLNELNNIGMNEDIKGLDSLLQGINFLTENMRSIKQQAQDYGTADEDFKKSENEQTRLEQIQTAQNTSMNAREDASKHLMNLQENLKNLEEAKSSFDKQAQQDDIRNNYQKKLKAYQKSNSPLVEAFLDQNNSRDEKINFARDLANQNLDWTQSSHPNGETALHIAVQQGDLEIVKFLREELKLNLDILNKEGKTSLWYAFFYQHKAIVEFLRKNGANGKENDLSPLLLQWINEQNIEAVQWLLEEKARQDNFRDWISLDINAKGKDYENKPSALALAVQKGALDLVKILLGYGADLRVTDEKGYTALHLAVYQDPIHIDLIKFLLEQPGVDIEAATFDGSTLLHLAARYLNKKDALPLIKLLLEKGVKLNVKNKKNQLPFDAQIDPQRGAKLLCFLAESGNFMLMRRCIEEGQIPVISRVAGRPSLLFLIYGSDFEDNAKKEIIDYLVSKNLAFDPCEKDTQGNCLLHFAAQKGDSGRVPQFIAVIKNTLLIKSNNVNDQNSLGRTPLHLAVQYGHIEMAKILLSQGARLDIKNNAGEMPFDNVQGRTLFQEIVKSLDNKGTLIALGGAKDLLYAAAQAGNIDYIQKIFQENKVDVNLKVIEGYTLLGLLSKSEFSQKLKENSLNDATKSKRRVLIEYLIQKDAKFDEVQDSKGNHFLHLLMIEPKNSENQELLQEIIKNWSKEAWGFQKSALLDAKNSEGKTLLHLAVENNNIELVSFLVKKGASVEIVDSEGKKPFDEPEGVKMVNDLKEKGIEIQSSLFSLENFKNLHEKVEKEVQKVVEQAGKELNELIKDSSMENKEKNSGAFNQKNKEKVSIEPTVMLINGNPTETPNPTITNPFEEDFAKQSNTEVVSNSSSKQFGALLILDDRSNNETKGVNPKAKEIVQKGSHQPIFSNIPQPTKVAPVSSNKSLYSSWLAPSSSFDEAIQKGDYEEAKAFLNKDGHEKYKNQNNFKKLPKSIQVYLLGESINLAQEYVKKKDDFIQAINKGDSQAIQDWFLERETKIAGLRSVTPMNEDQIKLLEYEIFEALNLKINHKTLLEHLIEHEEYRQAHELKWDIKEKLKQQQNRQDDAQVMRIILKYFPKEKISSKMLSVISFYDFLERPAHIQDKNFNSDQTPLEEAKIHPESSGFLESLSIVTAGFKAFTDKTKKNIEQSLQKATAAPKTLMEVYQFNRIEQINAFKISDEDKFDLHVMVMDHVPNRAKLDQQFKDKNKDKLPLIIRYQDKVWFYGCTPTEVTLLEPIIQTPQNKKLYENFLPRYGYNLVVVSKSKNTDNSDPCLDRLGDNEFRIVNIQEEGFSYKVKDTKGETEAGFIRRIELESNLKNEEYSNLLALVKNNTGEDLIEKLQSFLPAMLKITHSHQYTSPLRQKAKEKVPDEIYQSIDEIKGHIHSKIRLEQRLEQGKNLTQKMSDWIKLGENFKQEDIKLACDENGNTLLHLAVQDNLDIAVEWLMPTTLTKDIQQWFEKTFKTVKQKVITNVVDATVSTIASSVAGGIVGTTVAAATLPVLGPLSIPLGFIAGKGASAVSGGIASVITGQGLKGLFADKPLHELKERISVNVVNKQGNTPLHLAAATTTEKNLWIVAALLAEAGSEGLNKVNDAGNTPLHIAVRHGNPHIAALMMIGGADLNIQDMEGKTALHLAAISGNELLFEMLLKSEADIHLETRLGQTAAQIIKRKIIYLEDKIKNKSVNSEDIPVIEDERERYGRMQEALIKKSQEIIVKAKGTMSDPFKNLEKQKKQWWIHKEKAVSERSKKQAATDQQGNTILHILVQDKRNYSLVKELLADYEVKDLNRPNKEGNSPLHLAVRAGGKPKIENGHNKIEANTKMVKLLLDNGADPKAINSAGQIPAELTSSNAVHSLRMKEAFGSYMSQ